MTQPDELAIAIAISIAIILGLFWLAYRTAKGLKADPFEKFEK